MNAYLPSISGKPDLSILFPYAVDIVCFCV